MATNATLIPTKEQDFLEEDPALRGQNYVCLSFVSPEDLLRDKEVFVFQKYIERFSNDLRKITSDISERFPEVAQILNNIKDVHPHIFDPASLQDEFRAFKSMESERLDKEFSELNEFRTCVRGIKVRGVFDTVAEAKNRADFLKRQGDKFDIFIGQVGCWCPWSPNPNDIADSEYAETQLNTFMKQYKDNMANKDIVYEQRKQDMIDKAKRAAEAKKSEKEPTISVSSIAEALTETDPWTKAKEASTSDN